MTFLSHVIARVDGINLFLKVRNDVFSFDFEGGGDKVIGLRPVV